MAQDISKLLSPFARLIPVNIVRQKENISRFRSKHKYITYTDNVILITNRHKRNSRGILFSRQNNILIDKMQKKELALEPQASSSSAKPNSNKGPQQMARHALQTRENRIEFTKPPLRLSW